LPDGVELISAGGLQVASEGGLVLANGRALPLSAREYAVLLTLIRRRGRIVSREELYRLVWGGDLRAGDRSVDVYVSKLRNKLETQLPGERFIHTHVRFGYRLDAEPAEGQPWAGSDAPASGSGARAPGDSQPLPAERAHRQRVGRPRF
jgi:two-component system alkaline phosphatase synthesis response regulator PhoP